MESTTLDPVRYHALIDLQARVERGERITVGAAIDFLGYDKRSIDTALPQEWVNSVHDALDLEPRGNIVWSYEGGSLFGQPVPITLKGAQLLRRLNLCN